MKIISLSQLVNTVKSGGIKDKSTIATDDNPLLVVNLPEISYSKTSKNIVITEG